MANELEGHDNSKLANEIRRTARVGLFQRLASRFGFGVRRVAPKSKQSDIKLIQRPTEQQLDSKNSSEELQLISKLMKGGHMSSSVQDLFQEWMNDTQTSYANIEEREERLNALTHMIDNDVYAMAAVELVAAEVAMLTENDVFTVLSEDEKWQEETNNLLNNVWGFEQTTIHSLAWDIFAYGEAFQGNEVSSAGIVSFQPLKTNEVVERLEFKPMEVADFVAQMNNSPRSTGFAFSIQNAYQGTFENTNLQFNWGSQSKQYQSKSELLKNYLTNLNDTSANEFFTPHLLGYRLYNDTMVGPWQVTHYRYQADTSEFKPYGRPPLLSCLSAFKQMQRQLGLDDLRQLLSFPITQFVVNTGNTTTARAFDIVNTVKEEFENVGLMSYSSGMEGPSLCTNIWTSNDLLEIKRTEGSNPSDAGTTDKLKFFQDRVVVASGVPKTYLDPTSDGFQMSGVALTALFQPFRTKIETIRHIILAEVEDRIRLHYSILNREVPDFVITMNVLNPVATDDMGQKLQLADSILEAVAGLLQVEKELLPQEVKKDVLMKYANFSEAELDKYIETLKKEGPEEKPIEGVSEEEANASFGDGFGEGGEGGGDEGFEDMGGGEEMGESFSSRRYNRTLKHLIEARYRAHNESDMLFYLTESLGSLTTRKHTCHYCNKFNSPFNEEAAKFIKSKKLTKQKLNERTKKSSKK